MKKLGKEVVVTDDTSNDKILTENESLQEMLKQEEQSSV